MDIITENKVVPKLRFGEFDSEWKQTTLGNTSEIIGGGTPETVKPEYWGGTIQWFTPSELKQKYVSKSKRTITDIGLQKSSAKILPKGTLLFSSRATVGEVAIALNECCTNQGFQSFVVNSLNNSEFLYNWIIENKNQFIKLSSGSTFLEISKKEIVKLKLHLPSLPEQQKIASFLSAVDEKLQQLTKKKELLEEYKKGVMQKIFSQELRFKDANGNNYPDWEEKKLGEFIEVCSSKRVLQEHWKSSGVPFLRTREIKNLSEKVKFKTPIFISELLFEELKEKYGVPNVGDILATGVGTIGELYIVKENDKFYFKDGNVLWFKMNNQLNSIYLSQLFKTKFIRKQLSDNASITTVATFTIDGARKTKIVYPCVDEQKKIANFLSAIDDKIGLVSTQIENTKAFKKGLLQQMFV